MEFFVYILMMAAMIIPLWKLCDNKSISPAWALIAFIPFGAIALLWYLAFADDTTPLV